MNDPNTMSLDDYRKHQASKRIGKTVGRKQRNKAEGRPAKQHGPMPNDPPIIQSQIKFKDKPKEKDDE